MKITILAIGSKHDTHLAALISEYEKRLRQLSITWRILPSVSRLSPNDIKRLETEKIIMAIPSNAYVITLDEHGKQLSSEQFSQLLFQDQPQKTHVCIVIGGAFGLDDSIKPHQNFTWSLSQLVFPHQLVRLILTEQLYRAECIVRDHPYHHA